MSDFLIPLGGGNEIGGSAYYLSLEGIFYRMLMIKMSLMNPYVEFMNTCRKL